MHIVSVFAARGSTTELNWENHQDSSSPQFHASENRENFVLQVTPNAESSITFSVLHTKGLIGTILILLRCANVTLYLSRAAGFGHRVCGWIRIRGDCNTADGEILKDEVLSNRNAA